MIALCVIAALLAAGVLWLTFRVLRLRRSLEMERQESRRLKKLLTLGSREINAELDHMHRLRHDLRHSLPLIERSAQIPEALSLDLAATLERPIPPGRSWAVTVLARHYERRAEDQGVAADIRLEIDADLGDILPDLCLVLSNLLENALEALQREGGGWLRARCISTEGYLSLVVGNASTARLRSVNGRYLSSKAEGRFGLGLATVQEIARKYGGRAEFTADGEQFLASVFLPCTAPAEEPSSPQETPSSF
ncbi:GHKL domain-containing protein [uncultured Intestinimonas sp.]|uniref:GHKL domain-containing protein n=1 Tax=uncultured Intestinimonas sp. TaxID=1689265 RepID=UPI0025CC5B33|nr:GHKL domain-containing protein [uncultured Intestinimonas sp.]